MHESLFKIRSTQVDTFGHLNNAAYLEIYEWARWEWIDDQFPEMHRMIDEDHIGPAILKAELEFRKEIRMHDPITVRTWLQEARHAAAVIGQEMIGEDGSVCATLRLTFVMFDLERRRSVPLPASFRALVEGDRPAT